MRQVIEVTISTFCMLFGIFAIMAVFWKLAYEIGYQAGFNDTQALIRELKNQLKKEKSKCLQNGS